MCRCTCRAIYHATCDSPLCGGRGYIVRSRDTDAGIGIEFDSTLGFPGEGPLFSCNETLVWLSTFRIPCRPDYNWARLKVHDGTYVKDIVTSTTRILVPVYHEYHYSLLDVNMGTGVIRHHDSLGLSGHLSTRESAQWYQMAMNMVQVIREKNCWNNQPEMKVVEPHPILWTQGKDKDLGTNTCLMHVFHYMNTIAQHENPTPLIDDEANTTK